MPDKDLPTILVIVAVLIIGVGSFYFAETQKSKITQKLIDQDSQESQQSAIPSPPVPIPAENERTEARKTGVSWWLRNGKWVQMNSTLGEIKADNENPDTWYATGIIQEVDKNADSVSVEFADKYCVQDPAALEVEVVEIDDDSTQSRIEFESMNNTLLCGTGEFTAKDVKIRWRVWNPDEHQTLKSANLEDLAAGDLVIITAQRTAFEAMSGTAERILVVQ